MAFITETPNPFEPFNGFKRHIVEPGITIRQWLETQQPGFKEFEKPTICVVNGEPLMRAEWGKYIIRSNDIINFIVVTGWTTIIVALIIIIISVVLTMVLTPNAMTPPGAAPESAPVYTLKGQQNEARMSEPIEANYGRNRIFPSYAARPYYLYEDNDQYQHVLFCIGQGLYDVEHVQIGDTDISSFSDVTYEIIEPGDEITLFPANVYVSAEAGGQTIMAPNDPEYVAPGYVGPYVACAVGEVVNHIDVDLAYPKGLYKILSNGVITFVTVTVVFEAQLIDDAGAPLGAWFTIASTSAPGATTTPQRVTFGADVATGRYQVRVSRTTNEDTSVNVGDEVVWDGMKSRIVGQEIDYGNVTLLAIKAKATDNLNDQTQQKYNVIAVRKLPVRDSTGDWSAPIPTRSIVWAFIDIFRAAYGGNVTDDTFFDWDTIDELDALFESRDEHFDWTFRDPITVWDAAKAVAAVGRAVPMLVGSLITMRRDAEQTVPVTLFSPSNMVKDSFQWAIKLGSPGDYDCLVIQYVEPSTGYLQEEVTCVIPGSSTSDTPQTVQLAGCSDRSHAYHQGMYLLAVSQLIRENISFTTGLEGLLPSYGDLVAVSHDVPRWGQSGYVVHVEEDSSGIVLWLSEPLDFAESGQHYVIWLRRKDGSSAGPFDVLPTSEPKIVTIQRDSETPEDFLEDGTTEPMLFLFGIYEQEVKYGRVVQMEPQGGEQVKIVLVNDDPTIYSFDSLEPPALPAPPATPGDPEVPEFTRALRLTQVEGDRLEIIASWEAAFGAKYYVVKHSIDRVHWGVVGQPKVPFLQFTTVPGRVYVRVWPVGKAVGPYIEGYIIIGQVSNLRITAAWTGVTWTARWRLIGVTDMFQIDIYDYTVPSLPVLLRSVQQTTTSLTYDIGDMVADGLPTRHMLIEVATMYRDQDTDVLTLVDDAKTLAINNPVPTPPTGLSWGSAHLSSDGESLVVRFDWTNPALLDLEKFKVWVSDTDGFDPDDVEPLYVDQASTLGSTNLPSEATFEIPLHAGETFPRHYWRVGLFDCWGNENETNVCAQQDLALPWILEDGHWEDMAVWYDTTSTWQDS